MHTVKYHMRPKGENIANSRKWLIIFLQVDITENVFQFSLFMEKNDESSAD